MSTNELVFEEVAVVPAQGYAKDNPLAPAIVKLESQFDAELGRSVGALSATIPAAKRGSFASQATRAANALETPRTVRLKWTVDGGKATATFWLVEKIRRKAKGAAAPKSAK